MVGHELAEWHTVRIGQYLAIGSRSISGRPLDLMMSTFAEPSTTLVTTESAENALNQVRIELPGRTLRADASWTLTGNIAYAFCVMLWMVLISKLGTDASRGRYVWANAAAIPVINFASLGLRQMLSTDVRQEHRFSKYVLLRMVCLIVAMAIFACLAATKPEATAVMLLVVGGAKCLESASDIFFGRMQQFGRFDCIARSLIVKGLSSVACLALGLVLTHDALGAAGGIAAAFLLTLLLWDIPTVLGIGKASGLASRSNSPNSAVPQKLLNDSLDSGGEILKFVWHAAPLAFAFSLVALNANMPIYILRWHFGDAGDPMIGVFGALNYLPSAGAVLMNAIGVAASTRLAVLYSDGRTKEYYRLVWQLLGFCALIGIAGVLFTIVAGKPLITILYKKQDSEQLIVLVWLMVSGTFSYMGGMLGYAVTATRRFHRFVIPYLGVTLVSIVAASLLIPRYGLLGAAWSATLMNVASCAAPIFILIGLHFGEPHGNSARPTS